MLIITANSLDPDQARPNVRPALGPNCLDTDSIPERILQEGFEKSADDKKAFKEFQQIKS